MCENGSWNNNCSQLPSTWLTLEPPAMSPPISSSMHPKPRLWPEKDLPHLLHSVSALKQLLPRTLYPQSSLVKALQMGSLPLPLGHLMKLVCHKCGGKHPGGAPLCPAHNVCIWCQETGHWSAKCPEPHRLCKQRCQIPTEHPQFSDTCPTKGECQALVVEAVYTFRDEDTDIDWYLHDQGSDN
jgi:hypothetical protein